MTLTISYWRDGRFLVRTEEQCDVVTRDIALAYVRIARTFDFAIRARDNYSAQLVAESRR